MKSLSHLMRTLLNNLFMTIMLLFSCEISSHFFDWPYLIRGLFLSTAFRSFVLFMISSSAFYAINFSSSFLDPTEKFPVSLLMMQSYQIVSSTSMSSSFYTFYSYLGYPSENYSSIFYMRISSLALLFVKPLNSLRLSSNY